jgi:hypothetical protein
MRPAERCRATFVALLAAIAGSAAIAADDGATGAPSLLYGLTGDPLAAQSLLSARWSSLPLRLEAAAGLGAHEVRILGVGSLGRAAPQYGGSADFDRAADFAVDTARATYRYTLLAEPNWAMKFGLSTNVGEAGSALRPSLGMERSSFGSLPLLHVAGVGQWSPRLRLAFALDGLATGRGRALDLGLQVDYFWSPSMSVYGGYQVTEAAGEAESYYGPGLSNRANIGLRLRF